MAVFDLITPAELKRVVPAGGTAKDTELAEACTRASLQLEHRYDRRFVYRAPGSGEAVVVNAQNWADGAIAKANDPNAAGRTLIIAWETATGGTLTVTGTVAGVAGVTEVFDAANGKLQHGVKFFTAISAIVAAAAAGAGKVTVTTSLGYVEYHTPYSACSEIHSSEWPIQQVVEVNEDLNRIYGTTTALVAGTDYVVRERRRIARISNLLDFPFLAGYRTVKDRLSAGYFTTGSVPQDLKNEAAAVAAWIYRYNTSGRQGLESGSEAQGSFVLAGPPMVTSGQDVALGFYIRPEFERTWERDFDLEAVA